MIAYPVARDAFNTFNLLCRPLPVDSRILLWQFKGLDTHRLIVGNQTCVLHSDGKLQLRENTGEYYEGPNVTSGCSTWKDQTGECAFQCCFP